MVALTVAGTASGLPGAESQVGRWLASRQKREAMGTNDLGICGERPEAGMRKRGTK